MDISHTFYYYIFLLMACCQKYTLTNCFFGDFVHWVLRETTIIEIV